MRFPEAVRLRAFVVEQQGVLLSSFGSLVLRIVGLASTFLLGVLLARVLGPADYGVYGLVSSLVALAMNLALLGTPQLAVREMAVHSARSDWPRVRSLARSFLTATSLTSVALGLVAIAATFLFERSSRDHALALAGAMLMVGMGMTALIAAELRGLGLLIKGQFMDIVGRPAAAVVLTGGAWIAGTKLTPAGALWIQVCVATVAAAVSLAWLRRATHRDQKQEARTSGLQWLKAALPLGAVDVLRVFDGNYGIILVGIFGSALDLGIYRVATASAVLVTMPVTILHIVLAPTVSRLYRFGEHAELQRLLRLVSGSMVMVLIPMLLVLTLFGRPLVVLVFGHVYSDAWLPLAILCVAQVVLGFFGMGPILLAMADSERHLTVIYLVAVTAGVIAAGLLVPRYGANGAASAQVLSTGAVAVLSGWFARRRLGLGTTFLARASAATQQSA
jgi:O-antigen/teichoic acid export membrane protein